MVLGQKILEVRDKLWPIALEHQLYGMVCKLNIFVYYEIEINKISR